MAAAAVAETVALRAHPELGIQPGGPLLLRTPAEPSPALAGLGSFLPGKQTQARTGRARVGVGRAVSAGARHRAPILWPLQLNPLERSALCLTRPRRGSSVGSLWGLRAQGAGSGPLGPRDRFVYKHSRGRWLPAEGAKVQWVPGSRVGTCWRSQASLGCAIWRRGPPIAASSLA